MLYYKNSWENTEIIFSQKMYLNEMYRECEYISLRRVCVSVYAKQVCEIPALL